MEQSDLGNTLTELQTIELNEMAAIYRYITGYKTKNQCSVSLKLMTHNYIFEFMLSFPFRSLFIRFAVQILINVENVKNISRITWDANEIAIRISAKLEVIEDFKVLFSMKNSKKL